MTEKVTRTLAGDRLSDGSYVTYNPANVLGYLIDVEHPSLPRWIRENYWRLRWGLKETRFEA